MKKKKTTFKQLLIGIGMFGCGVWILNGVATLPFSEISILLIPCSIGVVLMYISREHSSYLLQKYGFVKVIEK